MPWSPCSSADAESSTTCAAAAEEVAQRGWKRKKKIDQDSFSRGSKVASWDENLVQDDTVQFKIYHDQIRCFKKKTKNVNEQVCF